MKNSIHNIFVENINFGFIIYNDYKSGEEALKNCDVLSWHLIYFDSKIHNYLNILV